MCAQAVVERAIAFSKVPRLILETLVSISEKLLDAYKSLEKAKSDGQRIGEIEVCVLPPEEKTPRHYGLMSGELGIIVFEPEFKCYATMPLSRAMRKYPMDKCSNSEKSEKLY